MGPRLFDAPKGPDVPAEYTDAGVLLEVIAETVEDAREAEQGGAGRIELVRDFDRGGLTPPLAVIEAVVKAVGIPVRVMLRESEPFVLADPGEPTRLQAAAREARERGAAGFVTGFLRDGAPDVAAVQEVLGALLEPVTFHRAFDDARRPLEALAALAAVPRVDRILTSGGAGAWPVRRERLRTLWQAAPPHLTILPGGGLDAGAVRSLAEDGFREAHVGRAARAGSDPRGPVSAIRVAELVAIAGGRARS
jgi:copper homeostasis protein